MKKSTVNHQPEAPIVQSDKSSLLIGLVIGLVAGALVSYAWQHQKVGSLNSQLATAQSAATAITGRTSASTPGSVNLLDATAYVSSFYISYDESLGNQTSAVQKYGTANLAFYKAYYVQHGFDPIVCAQDLPISIKASGVSTRNGVATVTVRENFGHDSETVTARVVDQGGLKIDSVTCPGSSGNLPPATGENYQ